jgi:transcriptional regulator with XRE-family HTH domain
MTDIPYKNWNAMNDKAIAEFIGAFIKHHRVGQNKTQETVAQAAGISRSTLSLLERGETVTLATLIQVLRVLGQLHVMEAFWVQTSVSPMVMAKLEKYKRKRASGKKPETPNSSTW